MARVNINRLKHSMVDNLDLLVDVLIQYGFKNPRLIKNDTIQCGFDDTSSGNAILISPNDYNVLGYYRFSTDEKGDIVELIKRRTNKNFQKLALELMGAFELGYLASTASEYTSKTLEEVTSYELKEEKVEYDILSEDLIGEKTISLMFWKDNILPSTQVKYNIWYHYYYHRICLNWRDISGNLIGATGRLNSDIIEDGVPKYYPVLNNFKKSNHLFGLYENKLSIMKNKYVVIFESEKSVLQCDSYGFYNTSAMGSSHISYNQLKLLKYLGVETIIFAYDEGLEKMKERIEKLIDANKNFGFKLKAIHDKENIHLKKGGKQSPSDIGSEGFHKLITEHLYNLSDLIEME